MSVKEFFDRTWVCVKDDYGNHSVDWKIETSDCSSQQDVIRITYMVTIIDGDIIFIRRFDFGTDGYCEINRICCYKIENIQ